MPEIEKKFVLRARPPTDVLGEGVLIQQGYLIVECGELRLRRKGDSHFLAVKGDGALSRKEWEAEIPSWVFNTLWPRTENSRVEKIRYSIPHNGLVMEVDQYRGSHQPLITLECEFPDAQAVLNLVLPAWAADAVDVTEDKRYKNKALAVYGLPQSERFEENRQSCNPDLLLWSLRRSAR